MGPCCSVEPVDFSQVNVTNDSTIGAEQFSPMDILGAGITAVSIHSFVSVRVLRFCLLRGMSSPELLSSVP